MISKRRSFTGTVEIEKVSPVFRGNNLQTGNYRQILAVLVFSKILEKNMNNRVCNYFKENKLLFPKQLDFQINTSTEHTILELVCNITKLFEENPIYVSSFHISLPYSGWRGRC